MNLKKMLASVITVAVMAAAVPMTGLLSDPLGLTADAVTYDEYGLYIQNQILRSVSADITDLFIPEDVTRIAAGAFSNCKNLTFISIPASVISINATFSSCTKLETISVDYGNEKYSSIDGVLFNYEGTELIAYPPGREEETYYAPLGLEVIKSNAFSGSKYLTNIELRYGVKNIGGFSNCIRLKSINIPPTTTAIAANAFSGCRSLEKIDVDEGNTKFSSIDGVLFNADKTKLIQYALGKVNTSYSVPQGVTEIGENAFSGSENLESIVISDSVKTIGANAFSDCITLTDLNISGSVAEIGLKAFMGCERLTSVNIPSGVQVIGAGAFSDCIRLTGLTLPDSLTEIGNGAFSGCKNLKSATIYGSPKLGDAIFENGTLIYGERGSSVEKYVDEYRGTLNYFFSSISSELKGDANDDGVVNLADLTAMLSHIVGKNMLTGFGRNNADVNSDGLVDIQDVILTLKICVS